MLVVGATIEFDLNCHYMRIERPVRVQETLNIDGLTKRVTDEIYIDHVFRAVISNEVICATQEVDSGMAKFKTISVDPRREQ